MSLQVDGLKALLKAFDDAPVKMDAASNRALDKTALAVQKDAKTNAPVLTGRLRASIAIRVGDDGQSREIYSDVVYAIYVEMGTLRMRAQPFLFPALNDHAGDFVKYLSEEVLAEYGG